MKTIIVPTDFSETAKNAVLYAMELARANNQNIHLVHTYELTQKTGMLPSIEHHIKKNAEQDMQTLLNELASVYPNVPVRFSIYKSTVEQGVALQAKKSSAALIIMGTHGTSAFKEIFLGSNSIAVMSNSKVPVLLIPNPGFYDGLDRILLTLDEVESINKESLFALKHLTEALRIELVAVNIATSPEAYNVNPYLELLNEVFGPEKVSFYEIISDDIERTIDEFAEEIEADLICTIKQKKGFLNDLLRKSTSKKMIYQYEFPLLVLNDKVEVPQLKISN